MRTFRLWTLCLLLSLLSPLAWSHAMPPATTPSHAVAQVGMPCHAHAESRLGAITQNFKHPAKPGCGDCSACHVVALLPARWHLHGPTPVHLAPGWHATPDCGRIKGCELYRPPQA